MKKLPFLFLFFVSFSCYKTEADVFDPNQDEKQQAVIRDAGGRDYVGLDPSRIYCGPGWGRKFCFFLGKHHGTTWVDGGSRIEFENFSSQAVFITFFNLDSIAPHGEGWRLGEQTTDGIKRVTRMKRDEVDLLWFESDYYGSGGEIEYSITYKCEVIDGLLHVSSSDDQTFTFKPSY